MRDPARLRVAAAVADGLLFADINSRRDSMIHVIASFANLVPLDVAINPQDTLPGTNAGQDLLNGLAWDGFILCCISIVIGAIVWPVSTSVGNQIWASMGKRAILIGIIGAAFIGSAATLVNWGHKVGTNAKPGVVSVQVERPR